MTCLACKSKNLEFLLKAKDFEYFSTDQEFSYFKCKDCEAISIDPPPINELNIIYPKTYYSFDEQKEDVVQKIKRYLESLMFKKLIREIPYNKDIKILDIGGGTGWMLKNISLAIKELVQGTIVDIDVKAKKTAHKNGYDFINSTVEEFDSVKKYNLILMLNLIEHISDPLKVLNKLSDYLEPGGKILIKTPNIDSLDFYIFNKTYWGGLHCPRHWILFNDVSFKKLINSTNLSLTSLRYTQGAPFWTWSLLNLLAQKKLINFNKNNPIVHSNLAPVFNAIFAAFDFIRLPFSKTSQMFIILEKK